MANHWFVSCQLLNKTRLEAIEREAQFLMSFLVSLVPYKMPRMDVTVKKASFESINQLNLTFLKGHIAPTCPFPKCV
jgi:hypothetical protein